jgi:hypothetical protein
MLFLRSMRSAICSRRRGQPSVLVYCRATRPDSSSTASAAALTFVHREELRRGHAAGKGDYIGLVGQRQQLTYSGALEKIHSVCKFDHNISSSKIWLFSQISLYTFNHILNIL